MWPILQERVSEQIEQIMALENLEEACLYHCELIFCLHALICCDVDV